MRSYFVSIGPGQSGARPAKSGIGPKSVFMTQQGEVRYYLFLSVRDVPIASFLSIHTVGKVEFPANCSCLE